MSQHHRDRRNRPAIARAPWTPEWIARLPRRPRGGKACHPDIASARRHRKALLKLGDPGARDAGARLAVYRCPACLGWHVGHQGKAQKGEA